MALITFMDQYQGLQKQTKLSDSTSTAQFKRDINTGGARLMGAMGRTPSRKSRFADLVAYDTTTGAGRYYQLPKDAEAPIAVLVYNGTLWDPLTEIVDEGAWRNIIRSNTTGTPTHYFIKGTDEIGLHPAPATAATDYLEVVFEARQKRLSQDDVTTGTVTLTNGSITVTASTSVFTASMVGRAFEVTDGNDDVWYRVASYTSATVVSLDNVYQGISGSGITYRIGQVMDIPEEYLEGPIDYGRWRYELGHDVVKAKLFENNFKDFLESCKSEYGRKGASAIVQATNSTPRGYDPLRDTPVITGV